MLKPLKLSDQALVYSVYDPAIDWIAMCAADEKKRDKDAIRMSLHLRAANEDLGVLSKELKWKTGEHPTEFRVGVIPSDMLTSIQDQFAGGHSVELRWRCFLCGLRDVAWPEKPETRLLDGVSYVDPSWIKKTFVSGLRQIGIEIGFYAWAFNRLKEEEIRL